MICLRIAIFMPAICVILVALASPVAAQVRITLPLQGYYRPGRAMPVLILADAPIDGDVKISADGAVPTVIAMHRASRVIVPLLMLSGSANKLSWSIGDAPAHAVDLQLIPLTGEQRLILAPVGEPVDDDLRRLTGASQAIVIFSDDVRALVADGAMIPGSLDVAVDRAVDSGDQFDDPLVPRAMAAGIVCARPIANMASERASTAAPNPAAALWHRVGSWEVARFAPAGPASMIGGEEIYAPTFGWHAGIPLATRRRAVLAGALVGMALLACLLLRGRIAMVVLVAVAGMSGGAIEYWRRALPSVQQVHGDVLVVSDDSIAQRDRWTYFTTRRTQAECRMPLSDGAMPVWSDAAHALRVGATIHADAATGARALSASLHRDERLALLARSIEAAAPRSGTIKPFLSPMRALAAAAYISPAMKIDGEIQSLPDSAASNENSAARWSSVVIRRH